MSVQSISACDRSRKYALESLVLVIYGFSMLDGTLLVRFRNCPIVLVFVVSGEPMLVEAGSLYSFSARYLTT